MNLRAEPRKVDLFSKIYIQDPRKLLTKHNFKLKIFFTYQQD